jgi:hypothetical protein
MRKLLGGAMFALAMMLAPGAFAQTASTDAAPSYSVEAAPATAWTPGACARMVRARAHRMSFVQPHGCGAPTSALMGCAYRIDIKAASLRHATGTRRHGHIASCI